MKRVTIEVPDVPHPGSHDTRHFFHRAAQALRGDQFTGRDIRNVSGSNVRYTIAAVLERICRQLDEVPDLATAPDGRSVHEELAGEERRALPAEYHQPIWDGLGKPSLWLCTVCWDEDEAAAWPCAAAEQDGAAVARAGGLRAAL